MKRILLFAVAALTFAACSENNDLAQPNQQTAADPGSVAFEAYTQRATTRGGVPGVLTTSTDDDSHGIIAMTKKGFGVFAYYTDNNDYDQRSVPNFMFNQKVTYNSTSSAWEYFPVVYWPNEYGDDAKSDDTDRVTFFAYAPYVDVVPTTGKLKETSNGEETWGIVQMNRNNAQGDPMIKYIASFNSKKSVDLAWGVCNDPNWALVEGHGTQNFTPGKPWIDVKRPALTTTAAPTEYQKVKFNFRHALAQMQVYIDADIDAKGHSDADNYAADGKTRVWVREITFKGFVMKGTLNLNNDNPNQPYWLDYNGQNDIVAEDVIVYDQRKDGKEGVTGAIATNEKVGGLNPRLIQDEPYKVADGKALYGKGAENALTNKTGVPKTPVTLFDNNYDANGDPTASTGNGIFHVIPVDGEDLYVEIVYDIETVDPNLAQNLSDGTTKGSSIENRIRKEQIVFTDGAKALKAGHSYKLNIHLGLNSVKFDAEVTPWIEEAIQDIDLPSNAPQFAAYTGTGSASDAGKDAANAYEATIPYKDNYIFALTGLNGGESTTIDDLKSTDGTGTTATTFLADWGLPSATANGNGVAIHKVQIGAANPYTVDQIQELSITGNQSAYKTYFKFTQQAHPLFFQITGFADKTVAASGTDPEKKKSDITIVRYNDALHTSTDHWTVAKGWLCGDDGTPIDTEDDFSSTANYIKVWRNGTELTWNKTIDDVENNDNFFMPNLSASTNPNYTNTITIGDQLQPGDVIKVEIKTGDAPAETVTATVGGIFYTPTARTVVYRVSETYDIAPNYIGSIVTPTITYASSVPAVVATPSNKDVPVLKAGDTQITATISSPSAFDIRTVAKLDLHVIKQDAQIPDAVMKSEELPDVQKDENMVVKSLSGQKAKGAIDFNTNAGAITINTTIVSETKDGVSVTPGTNFKVESNVIKVNSALTTGSTYTVTVKAEAAEVTDKFNACTKILTYTFKAKD